MIPSRLSRAETFFSRYTLEIVEQSPASGRKIQHYRGDVAKNRPGSSSTRHRDDPAHDRCCKGNQVVPDPALLLGNIAAGRRLQAPPPALPASELAVACDMGALQATCRAIFNAPSTAEPTISTRCGKNVNPYTVSCQYAQLSSAGATAEND